MTVKRTPKMRKRRGSRTHGWGLVHRGSGQKGGAGNAGSGKKADAKKPSFWNRPSGRNGFKPQNPNHNLVEVTLNLQDVEQHLDTWLKDGTAHKEGEQIHVDLTKKGITKLLATGKIHQKLTLTVPKASANSVKKVQGAGGNVVIHK